MNVVAATMLALFYLITPVKSYVKPGEPVSIRFVQGQQAAAAKMVEVLGLKAVELPGLLDNVAALELVDKDSVPQFQVYTFDGIPLAGERVVYASQRPGVVDIAAYYPQISKPGTYILTFKSAGPLVINTLANPGTPKGMGETVATHIVPLSYAVITTDKGDIKATFAYDVAPHTVDNFITLANEKFYDDSRFHRIIKGFMIQGGDSLGASDDRAGTGGPGHNLVQEFNDKPHVRGVLSMARTSEPDTAGSQFFIMHAANAGLNNQYTAFGQVIDGMAVVDKIIETPVTDRNGSTKPENRPVIKSIRILPATAEMYGIKAK
ncbi:MAG: peptidylprolyl isomerase [Phycisphaerae bacterium]